MGKEFIFNNPKKINTGEIRRRYKNIHNSKETLMEYADKSEDYIKKKVGKIKGIKVFEVSEDELNVIEKSDFDKHLNIALSLFSVSISLTASIFFSNITNIKIFNIFVILIIVSGIISIVMFIIWFNSKDNLKDLIIKIKSR